MGKAPDPPFNTELGSQDTPIAARPDTHSPYQIPTRQDMEILLIIGLGVVLVWAAVAWKKIKRPRIHWMPVLGAAVVIVGSVLGRDFFSIDVGPIPITLDRILLGGMTGAFLALILLGYVKIQSFNPTDWGMLGLTIVLCVSTLSHDWTFRENMPLSRLLFFNLVPFLVYCLMRHNFVGKAELSIISIMFVVFGFYLAGTSVAEWQGWQWAVFPKYILNPDFEEFLGRGRGPFLNPVSNGIFMITGFVSLVLWFPRVRQRHWKLVVLLLAPFFLAGIYATLTRSNWMALILATGLVGWLMATRKGRAGLIIGAAVSCFLVIGLSGNDLLEFKRDKYVSVHEMKQSASLRPLFVIVAGRMFQDRPLAGCGFGQYAKAKYPYLQDPTSKYPLYLTKSYMQHNLFLAYATETGLIGLLILLFLLFQFTRTACRIWYDKQRDIRYQQLALTMLALLVCHVVNGMFHDVSIAPMLNMLLYFFAGILTSVDNRVPDFVLFGNIQESVAAGNPIAVPQ